jgi:hypothetical protein
MIQVALLRQCRCPSPFQPDFGVKIEHQGQVRPVAADLQAQPMYLERRHGYVFVGRGFGVRTAANGTKSANDRYFAVCFLGDDTAGRADVTPKAYAALGELLRSYDRRIPRPIEVRPHSDFVATPCPGEELRRYISRRGWLGESLLSERGTNATSRASRIVD